MIKSIIVVISNDREREREMSFYSPLILPSSLTQIFMIPEQYHWKSIRGRFLKTFQTESCRSAVENQADFNPFPRDCRMIFCDCFKSLTLC